MTHNEKKDQSIETDPEMTQVINIADKDSRRVIISVFRMFKMAKKKIKYVK